MDHETLNRAVVYLENKRRELQTFFFTRFRDMSKKNIVDDPYGWSNIEDALYWDWEGKTDVEIEYTMRGLVEDWEVRGKSLGEFLDTLLSDIKAKNELIADGDITVFPNEVSYIIRLKAIVDLLFERDDAGLCLKCVVAQTPEVLTCKGWHRVTQKRKRNEATGLDTSTGRPPARVRTT